MIAILYQYKFGGSDFLLQRLESWLVDNKYDVISVVEASKRKITIDLLIMPTSEMNKLYRLSRNGLRFNRILVWSMGHGAFKAAFYNTQFDFFLWGLPKKIIDLFINSYALSLLKTNSLIFTDQVGFNHDLSGLDSSAYNIEKLVFPIAIAAPEVNLTLKIDKPRITIGWVGRISKDFKVLPLVKLIKDLKGLGAVHSNLSRLVIVGDGDGAELLQGIVADVECIQIDWIKSIDSTDLGKFINSEIDVLFAMGTSALDGANALTPTVIVQPFSCFSDEPVNGYRWIFDSKGFSLGEFPGGAINPPQIDVDLHDIFTDIDKFGLPNLSAKSKEYSLNFLEEKVFHGMFSDLETKKINKDTLLYLFLLSTFNDIKLLLKKMLAFMNITN